MNQTSLKIILFHYHLLPGGVTDVIKLSLEPLLSLERVNGLTIVCGSEENRGSFSSLFRTLASQFPEKTLKLEVFRDIGYLKDQNINTTEMKHKLIQGWGGKGTIWLIHNYHLGKNWIFTAALLELARQGEQKMIFQIHDFPECGRFENLKILRTHIRESLYPEGLNLRYGVINPRDYNILRNCGMNQKELFLLENPVSMNFRPVLEEETRKKLKQGLMKQLSPKGRFYSEGSIWLYPVRSIRRKNILEGGFMTALLEEETNLIVSLPGLSPAEKNYSDLCQEIWKEGLIPGFWGTGVLPPDAGPSYEDTIAMADLIFSSSVQEGFGYLYLNALVWQKPLLARKLDIMGGFLHLMEDYPAYLYHSLELPLEKSIKKSLKEQYENRFQEKDFAMNAPCRKKLSALLSRESIDYGWLSLRQQYLCLKKLKDPSYKKDCQCLNTGLLKHISRISKSSVPDKTGEIHKFYGKEAFSLAFDSILDSFTGEMEKKEKMRNFNPDRSIREAFNSLDYLRLIY